MSFWIADCLVKSVTEQFDDNNLRFTGHFTAASILPWEIQYYFATSKVFHLFNLVFKVSEIEYGTPNDWFEQHFDEIKRSPILSGHIKSHNVNLSFKSVEWYRECCSRHYCYCLYSLHVLRRKLVERDSWSRPGANGPCK